MSSEKKPTVLLIEANHSLRRLITLGLQSRSMHVLEADSVASIAALDESSKQADLLVLDIDSDIHQDWSSLKAVQSHPGLSQLPIVILTWEEQASEKLCSLLPLFAITQTPVMCQPKPFDARALFATIEQMLSVQATEKAALEAKAEEALLAAYAVHTAPSIWPIITALGLLLAVTGLLFQVAVSVIGGLIVVVALLLWALRAGSVPNKVALSSVV